MIEDPLQITRTVAIPLSEIDLRASRSSGPGGQHANVTASRIEAVFDIEASESLTDAQKARIRSRCGPRVTAIAQDARSQIRNRELALTRLRDRLATALHVHKPRRPTKPSRSAKAKRLDSKRRHSAKKAARRAPPSD